MGQFRNTECKPSLSGIYLNLYPPHFNLPPWPLGYDTWFTQLQASQYSYNILMFYSVKSINNYNAQSFCTKFCLHPSSSKVSDSFPCSLSSDSKSSFLSSPSSQFSLKEEDIVSIELWCPTAVQCTTVVVLQCTIKPKPSAKIILFL